MIISKTGVPDNVIGVDGETESLKPNAKMLTLAGVVFDVLRLQYIKTAYVKFNPNDPGIKEPYFHIDPGTQAWWRGEGNPQYSPSEAARKEAYSGNMSLDVGLKFWVDELEPYRRDKDYVVTCRGPEFDWPIVENALVQCGLFKGPLCSHVRSDSDRTAERVLRGLGFEMDETAEETFWDPYDNRELHMADYDAAKEAYRTARMYHLIYIINQHGLPAAVEANKLMRAAKYDATVYLTSLDDKNIKG